MVTHDELVRKMEDYRDFLPENSPMKTVSPDYWRLQQPMMWGGIWQVPGLDVQLRSFATISAQCVNGWDFGLQHQIKVGLTAGITPKKIKGIFIQLLFYAGIPTTVWGLLQAQKVIDERQEWKDADVPIDADWLDTVEQKLQRGSAIRTELWGAHASKEIEGSLAQQMVPEAADLVDGYNFGEVWARADLEPRDRMVCVLAVLMARGHLEQLKQYIGYALNMGFNKREICEVLSQAGWYRGWAHVEDALEQAKAVFDERGI
ncbi:MAG: carboxymuconolactone decarboxylase family protein [Chloroflexi bacterium]|nr:carboxymuconolactone decarboxylase family protein [Chloroflexota bacterium]